MRMTDLCTLEGAYLTPGWDDLIRLMQVPGFQVIRRCTSTIAHLPYNSAGVLTDTGTSLPDPDRSVAARCTADADSDRNYFFIWKVASTHDKKATYTERSCRTATVFRYGALPHVSIRGFRS